MLALLVAGLVTSPLPNYRIDIIERIGVEIDVNASGTVLGGMYPPYRWSGGKSEPLPKEISFGSAMNEGGWVAGTDWLDNHDRAYIVKGQTVEYLPLLPKENDSAAKAINGKAEAAGSCGRFQKERPVRWTAKGVEEIPLPEGFSYGSATGINEAGWVAVTLEVGTSRRAGRFRAGNLEVLPIPEGCKFAGSDSIGESGDVCGYFWKDQDKIACVWEEDRIRPLPALPGQFESQAMDIDRSGRIVGFSGPRVIFRGDGPPSKEIYESRATLWMQGRAIDLNERIVNRPRGLFLWKRTGSTTAA